MDSKDRKVLNKILEHAQSILEETKNIADAQEFHENNDQTKAALFDLLQIGELAKDGLSQDVVTKMTAIPWHQIYALRNRIVHGYASVDHQVIWETIQFDIPQLIDAIRSTLDSEI
ncbi:MAG: DUF86 domain-containing protein [Firmicutes bacterium]|nr:DUF86 domain-containing protein [Bacillota bacterium]